MNELQLIADCKEHKRQAQKTLYETYSRKMFGVCLRYASDADQAKDLLQDGFLRVFDKISSYEGRGSFEGWMRRLFVNLALENLRKNKTFILSSEEIDDVPDIADEDLDSDAMQDITQEELLAMIQELPKGYSAVFSLYAIEDCSHKEIAKMLDISEGTSRSQYIRARRLLQEKVSNYLINRP